jgi:EAL domain-containing protein (putative c-di-GMP-specific phosphodiesterase class I)
LRSPRLPPVDYLKIDGSFVKDLQRDPIDRAVTETINHIGHIMGIKTVAEFAESIAIVEELQKMGVDFAQGYGVCTPVPLDETSVQRRRQPAHLAANARHPPARADGPL